VNALDSNDMSLALPRLSTRSYNDSFSDNFLDDDRRVLGNRLRLSATGNLVDEFFANRAPYLPDAAGGNGHDDAPHLADEILGPALGGRLLAEEKSRKEIHRCGQEEPADGAKAGCWQRSQALVRRDGAESAKRGDEDADDAGAEESGTAMIEIVVEATVEVLEYFAKKQRNYQKEETDRGNREKDGERAQGQEVHV
jgi:hypothetical protein